MGLNTKKRITAISVVAVLLIASIVVACVYISPVSGNFNGSDISTEKTEYNSTAGKSYGMSQVGAYDATNSRVALIDFDGDASHFVAIWYPTKISMDVSESLQDVGYYFFYTGRFYQKPSSGAIGKILMYNTALGYYGTSALKGYTPYGEDSAILQELRKNADYSDALALTDTFNAPGNAYGLRKEDRNAGDDKDKDNAAWVPTSGDFITNGFVSAAYPSWDYGYTMMMQGKATSTTSGNVKFKPVSDPTMPLVIGQDGERTGTFIKKNNYFDAANRIHPASSFKTEGLSDLDISGIIKDGNFNISGTRVGNPATADKTDDNFSGTFTIPLSENGLEIDINIYDKSDLKTSLDKLKKTYEDLKDRVVVTNIDEYNAIITRANDMLASRFVTPARADMGIESVEVNSETVEACRRMVDEFKLNIERPSSDIIQRVYADKESYVGSDFWSGYHENYFDISVRAFADKNISQVSQIYDVDGYILGISVKEEYADCIKWSAGAAQATVRFQIIPADMSVSRPQLSAMTKPYNGELQDFILDADEYVSLKGRMAGTLADVYMSTQEGTFPDEPGAVTFKEVGRYTVYFKASAKNHNDATGSFEVEVSKANVTLTFDEIIRRFGDAPLTSDEIAGVLGAVNGDGLFEGLTSDAARDEIAKYFSFVPVDQSGNALSGILNGVGRYTVNINAKNFSDGETQRPWSDRIALTVEDSSNQGAYRILPKLITVDWSDASDTGKIYYDGHAGHRPTATFDETQLVEGDSDEIRLSVGIDGLAPEENAVNAATYTARASLSGSNYAVSNETEEFTISARPIEITVLDRNRTYGAVYGDNTKGAAAIRRYYQEQFVQNPASVYSLSTDVNDGYGAIISGDDVSSIFGVRINGTTTSAEGAEDEFYTVGNHALEMIVPQNFNTNYEIVAHTNGVFRVDPAKIEVSVKQFDARYKGEAQNFSLSEAQIVGISGYEAMHRDSAVKVEYSADGVSWSADPVRFKDVGTHTMYFRVSADNHVNISSQTISVIIAVAHAHFDISKNASAAKYGDATPTSQEIVERLSVEAIFDKPEDSFEILNYVEFYLIDSDNATLSANNADAGSYTVRHRIKDGIDDTLDNYDINYVNSSNVNAYGIAPKELRVDWTQSGEGWDGDRFTYNAAQPTVQPRANAEDVVAGDTIVFAALPLGGFAVGEYTVSSNGLTNPRNQKNYTVAQSELSHNFAIVQREVTIEILPKEAVYGRAKEDVALGTLVSAGAANANWKYADGSDVFMLDHYSSWRLDTTAHTDGFKNVGNYPIYLIAAEGSDDVVSNYNVRVVNTLADDADTSGVPAEANNTGYGNFAIVEAELTVSARYFDLEWTDGGVTVPLSDIAERIVLLGDRSATVSLSVGALHLEGESADVESETWSESDVTIPAAGKYFVWIKATAANHSELKAIIYINALSDYIDITVGGSIVAEYGYDVYSSDELFDMLFVDGSDVSGVPEATDFSDALAWLKSNGTLFVGSGESGDISPLTWNKNVGSYSVYYRLNDGLEYTVRFIPKADSSKASNIDVYTVQPRKVQIVWGDIDEEYGEHGENSKSHTNITIGNVVNRDGAEDSVRLIIEYSDVDGGKEGFHGDHIRNVGEYKATVVGVSNPKYTVEGAEELSQTFRIEARKITVTLKDRSGLVYGDADARVDTVNAYLNANTSGAAYSLDRGLADGDSASEVFALSADLDGQTGYLDAKTYTVGAQSINGNYNLTFVGNAVLTIGNAQITFDRMSVNSLTYNGRDQEIHPSEMIFTLRGDMSANDAGVQYSKDGVQWSDSISFKAAGLYKFYVKITADNHEEKITDDGISVRVNKAEVIIDMTAASKRYGDAIDGNLSDWLKSNCNIAYLDHDGNPADIDGIADDFEFYVVNKTDGGWADPVGEYRVYHNTEIAAMSNYSVRYASSGDGNTVNAKAYSIYKRETSVVWQIDSDANWQDAHTWIYNGSAPALAAYVTVVDTDKADGSTVLQKIIFTDNGAAVNYAVGSYSATAGFDDLDSESFARNYRLLTDGNTYDFTVVKRDVSIVIFDKTSVYGDVQGMPIITALRNDDWKFEDENFEFPTGGGDKISLALDAQLSDGYLAVGEYRIAGTGLDGNYNIIFKSADGNSSYAKYTVTPASVKVEKTTVALGFNGSSQSVDVKAILASESGAVEVAGAMRWEDAIVEYKKADGTWTREIPTVGGVGESISITYRVVLDNHKSDEERVMTVTVTVAKIELKVSAMSSVYGDALLASDAMIDGGYVTLGEGSTVRVDLKSMFEFYVDSDAKNSGFYDIAFSWKNPADSANYDVKFVGDAGDANPQHGIYEIVRRNVVIDWNDDALVYDGGEKKQTAFPGNLAEGDEALATNFFVFEANSNVGIDAGNDYRAIIIGLSEDAAKNYVLESGRAEYVFAILPKDVTVEWSVENFTYDGEEHVISAEYLSGVVAGDDAASITISVSGAQIDAGTHTAYAKAEGNSNYKIAEECASKTFVIDQKTVEIEWGSESYVYDGHAHTLGAKVKADSLVGSDECSAETTSFTDRGEHFVTVASLSNGNYKVKDGEGKTMTISQADNAFQGSIEVPSVIDKASGLPQFSGENAVSAKFGEVKVKYYRDEALSQEYTGDPAKAPAGKYFVVVSVDGNDNYKGLSQTFEVEVKGANVGLILGITIPLVLIAAGAVVAIVLVKKKKGAKA